MLILRMVLILLMYQVPPVQSQTVNCASGPCQNGALCEDTDTGIQCFCVDGYAGELCEINFDDCSSTPCRNNATCTDLVAGYTCLCSPGFTGQDCQINIDECTSSPCSQNGKCIDLVNGFVCECFPPYRGDNCSVLPCDILPCENEAICRNDLSFNESLSGFVCDCITGFSGPRCEINLEDCDLENLTSCSGNGLCVDGVNDYSCLCEPGWVGDYCESPVDDCIGSSCKNNATCFDLHLGYLCTCKSGYEGSLCEREKDECTAWQPCKNGAVCVDLFNAYRCDCTEGWFGVNCSDEVNECENNSCQNGAQCIDVIGGFQCRCPPFYTGLLCETLYNPCAQEYNPCQNNANCIVPPDGQYRCFCLAGFTGVHCEVNVNECLSMPCENNSTCEDITAGYICHCTPGWEGQNCQNDVDDCASEPCLNGADCMDQHNGFVCNCTREYQGPVCDEIVDFCLRNPCFHDSTCLSFVGGYTCVCSSPYTGEHCLDLIDVCQSAPCINNGTCMNTVFGFRCNCPLPYTGKTCDEQVDFCESEPCVLGTCVSLDNDFVCLCPEYLTGKQCTDIVDYCQSSPCENEGNCINAEFDFRCICAYGFTGRTCTQMIDFCSEEPCQNEANCSNIPGGFQCACPREFTGDLCQDELPAVISSSVIPTISSFSDSTTLSVPARSTTPSSTYSTLFQFSNSVSDLSTPFPISNSVISSSIINPSSVMQQTPGANSILQSIDTSSVVKYSSLSEIPISFFDSLSKSTITAASSTAHTVQSALNTVHISSSNSASPDMSTASSFSMMSNNLEMSTVTAATLTSLPDLSYDSIQISRIKVSSTPAQSSTVQIHSSKISSVSSPSVFKDISSYVHDLSSDSIQISRIKINSTSVQSSTVEIHSSKISSVSSPSLFKDISSSVLSSSAIPVPDSVEIFSSQMQVSEFSFAFSSTSAGRKSSIKATSVQTISIFYQSTYAIERTSSLDTSSKIPLLSFSLEPFSSLSPTMSSTYILNTYTSELTGVTFSALGNTSQFSVLHSSSVTVSHMSPVKPSSYIQDTHTSDFITSFPTLAPSTYSPRSLSTFSVDNIDSTKLSQISTSLHTKESSSLSASFTSFNSTVTLESSFTTASSFVAPSLHQTLTSGFDGKSLSIRSTFSSKDLSFSSRSWELAPSSDTLPSMIFSRTASTTSTAELTSSSIGKSSAPVSVKVVSTFKTPSSILIVPTRSLNPSSERSSSEINMVTPMYSLVSTSFDTQTEVPSVDTIDTVSDLEMTSTISSVFIILQPSSTSTIASALATTTAELGSHSNTAEPLSVLFSTVSSFHSAFDTSEASLKNSREMFSSVFSEQPSLTRHKSYSHTYTSIPFTSENVIVTTLDSSFEASNSLMTESTLFTTVPFTILPSLFTEITLVLTGTVFVPSSSSSSSSYLSSPFPINSFNMSSRASTMIYPETLLSSRTELSTLFLTGNSIFVTTTAGLSPVSSIGLASTEISSVAVSLSFSRKTSSAGVVSSSLPVTLESIHLLSSSVSVETSNTTPFIHTNSTITRTSEVSSNEITISHSTFLANSEPSTSTMHRILPTKSVPFSSFDVLYSSSTAFFSTTFLVSSDSEFISSVAKSSSLIVSNTIIPATTIQSSQTSPSVSTTTPAPHASCENFICYNGGQCREDISGTYCDCGENYLGTRCETETTACEGYVCENGGICIITLTIYNVQVPKCSCPLPFVGQRCENEKLIFYPTFIGSSYLEFLPPAVSSDQSNEIYVSVKTIQRDATILYSANQEVDYKHAAFISLQLTNGQLRYTFSCDGVMTGVVETEMNVNTGDVYEIIIRQVWSEGPGEWCSAAVMINSRVFVSSPLLTIKQSQHLGKLYLGGVPRYTYKDDTISDTYVMEGYIGCIHNFQVNQKEINLVTMAITGVDIDNCNVPVCQHDPCKNGATCYSSGEEWYCSCLPGYGGALCERKLCDANPCQHGGTCIILEEAQDQLCLCAFGRGGIFCEKALSLTIPHFSGNQYGYSSYLAYSHPHYVEDDLELEFSFIFDSDSSDSSLILFMGNTGSYDGRRDFMAVGIEFGFIVFRFDLGSGYGQIYSAEKLEDGLHQHSLKFGRDGRDGWLQVDNQRNVTGRSPGVLTALNTNSKLYIGNVDSSEIGILPTGAKFEDGFKGCIFNMKIKSHITNFITLGSPPGHVINGRNIGQCSSMSCDHSPCQNGAECRDLGASIYCVCGEGWKGTFCTDVITVCDIAHACGDGSTCIPNIAEGYHCLCPLGRKGEYCEQAMNISDPLFLGEGSYMAFEPVYIKRQIDIRMQVKLNTPDGLLFYVAQRLHSHAGDFLSVALNRGRIELNVDVGSGVNTIQSEAELVTDRWYMIEAGRNVTYFYISVDGEASFAQLTGMMTFLDVTTNFYIGGLPNLEDAAPEAFENEPEAFQGCIRELIVNGEEYELDQYGAKDGRNIEDCDGTSCGYSVCSNEGSCSAEAGDTFTCSCTESFIGITCDVPIQCANHSCMNGNCRAVGENSYSCDCFIGWRGKFCDEVVDLGNSVDYKAGSYMYLIDDKIHRSNKSNTNISFSFRTTQIMCLILWNGQTYTDDEDYLGVGIQDGRLKLVWNLGWYSRGEIVTSIKFNDGSWHSVTVERVKQMLTLHVDRVTYESRVSGDFYTLDTRGEFYLGSFKEGKVHEKTLGYYTEPFKGCLKDLQIDNNTLIDFNAVRYGINILSCDPD